MRIALTILFAAALSGCGFYFGDDDCEELDYGGQRAPALDVEGQRNPYSGQCEYYGGVPYPCDDGCGPCLPGDAEADPAIALPSWGLCESFCTGLDESSCQATPGCRAVYTDGEVPLYRECWQIDQSGPVATGCASNLDAETCSMDDACVAIHADGCAPADPLPGAPQPYGCIADYLRCGPEQVGCYGEQDCGDGFHCNASEVCLPEPGCGNTDSPVPVPCDAVCYGFCVPNVPPNDSGSCYGEVLCATLPPACPASTTPGIKDGCYTGYCIPLDQCEVQMACANIPAEATCIARPDCTPLYEGVNCTCDPQGQNCVCTDHEFSGCRI